MTHRPWLINKDNHGTVSHKINVFDYESADSWVSGGRTPGKRHVGWASSRYAHLLRPFPGGDIHLMADGPWNPNLPGRVWMPVITWTVDNFVIIDNDNGTRYCGWALGSLASKLIPGLRISRSNQHKHLLITTPGNLRTPARESSCRRCHGFGRLPEWCRINPTDTWVDGRRVWMCKCGHTEPHQIYSDKTYIKCNKCNGSGRAVYGNKPIPIVWDGSRIAMDADYNLYSVNILGELSPYVPPK